MFGKLLGQIVSAPIRCAEVATRVVADQIDDGATSGSIKDIGEALAKAIEYIADGEEK